VAGWNGFAAILPGVGRKVAAPALNASTLAMPVLIVDSHVLRVFERLGFVARGAGTQLASVGAPTISCISISR